MAFDTATVDTLSSRRRIGRSETLALTGAAVALAVGVAAWLTAANSSVSDATADVSSFDDRFAPSPAQESLRLDSVLQPLSRSAFAALQAKVRDAKGVLAQQLASSDWRGGIAEDGKVGASKVA